MLHMRKLRCTSKEWMNTSMRHHALLQTGFHGPPNWQNSSQGDVRVSIAIETCGDSARLSGNYVIAMKWWLSAADKGNASAQMKAAYLYEEGRVVSRVFRTFGFELSGARYWLKQ